MNVFTIVRFLLGSRQAILDVATARYGIWVGALLVLSAGFAREYDGEDLLHEPWHLLIPFAASLVTSVALYVLLRKQMRESPFVRGYLQFLTLYWMTAPLAWLYAIPVERFNSAEDSIRWNLIFLAVVAVWRVLLMVRIVSVMLNISFLNSFIPVMFFADMVVVAVLVFTPLPVISIMGGIRLTDSEVLLQRVTLIVLTVSIVSWPIWLAAWSLTSRGDDKSLSVFEQSPNYTVGMSAWGLAVAALLVWIPLLPGPQREQQLRRRVEHALRSGEFEDALTTMSAHDRSDFPPHWDPPPRIGYGEFKPDLLTLLEAVQSSDEKRWVVDIFEMKLIQYVGHPHAMHRRMRLEFSETRFDRLLSILEKVRPDSPVREEVRELFQRLMKMGSDINPKRRDRIKRLIGDPVGEEQEPNAGPPRHDLHID